MNINCLAWDPSKSTETVARFRPKACEERAQCLARVCPGRRLVDNYLHYVTAIFLAAADDDGDYNAFAASSTAPHPNIIYQCN